MSKFTSNLKILNSITLFKVTPGVTWTQHLYIYIYIKRERERERETHTHTHTNNTIYMGHVDLYSHHTTYTMA